MANAGNGKRSTRAVILVRVLAAGSCAVVVLALIFLLASLYVARTRHMHDRALAEKRRQRIELLLRENAEDVRSRLLQEGSREVNRASRKPNVEEVDVRRHVISVAIDAAGNVQTGGRKSSLGQLRNLLESETVVPQTSLAVVLYVDPRCPFEHVARVQGLCDELGVGVARIHSRDLSPPANAPPKYQTADSRG
jgi:biopolymer transport protein ExbD